MAPQPADQAQPDLDQLAQILDELAEAAPGERYRRDHAEYLRRSRPGDPDRWAGLSASFSWICLAVDGDAPGSYWDIELTEGLDLDDVRAVLLRYDELARAYLLDPPDPTPGRFGTSTVRVVHPDTGSSVTLGRSMATNVRAIVGQALRRS